MTGLSPVLGVSTLVVRGRDILLVRRSRSPLEGLWSLPGGRLEYGEALAFAAARELKEETGIEAANFRRLDVVELLNPGGEPGHFVLVVFQGDFLSGQPTAGDDAAEARWVSLSECRTLPLTDQTRMIIDRYAGASNRAG